MRRRGKRQSKSQKIGRKGEAIFRKWAVENDLIPQKTEEDYGIDFFSQPLTPVSEGTDEVTGKILAVQVKSVEGQTRPRVRLDRSDVENAIRIEAPYCLIGIQVETESVHFLFLDEILLGEFYKFLSSGKGTISVTVHRGVSSDKGRERFVPEECSHEVS